MSVTQSERLGASMSDTLTIQADNMRNVRRQRARTKAMKAPVKMVFPLVFCIFPAIFVVALLPSLLSHGNHGEKITGSASWQLFLVGAV